MSITRRSFLVGLTSLFGVSGIPELRAEIKSAGRPILLSPSLVTGNLYVYEGGILGLGEDDFRSPRPTFRQYWHDSGVLNGNDEKAVRRYAEAGWGDPDLADQTLDDDTWGEAFELQYGATAAAYHLLRRLKVGTSLRSKALTAGRLDFSAGSNHPCSNDLWVEVYDDLSVSLLQARLIELNQPIQVVMDTHTVTKLDGFDYESEPSDE